MADIRVEMNHAGARELLCSAEVMADIRRRGEAIQSDANSQIPESGYQEEPFGLTVGTTDRAFANVYTKTNLGKLMQAKHDTLTKALDAGRS